MAQMDSTATTGYLDQVDIPKVSREIAAGENAAPEANPWATERVIHSGVTEP